MFIRLIMRQKCISTIISALGVDNAPNFETSSKSTRKNTYDYVYYWNTVYWKKEPSYVEPNKFDNSTTKEFSVLCSHSTRDQTPGTELVSKAIKMYVTQEWKVSIPIINHLVSFAANACLVWCHNSVWDMAWNSYSYFNRIYL